jgi:hypothetical protein
MAARSSAVHPLELVVRVFCFVVFLSAIVRLLSVFKQPEDVAIGIGDWKVVGHVRPAWMVATYLVAHMICTTNDL